MKRILPIVLTLTIILACVPFSQPPATTEPGVEDIVAMTLQALTSAAPPATVPPPPPSPQPAGTDISYGNIRFRLPQAVAASALAGTIPAVLNDQQGAPWDIAPAYVKFELDGYFLQNTFHDARILVYPAPETAALGANGASTLAKLQAILDGSAAPNEGNLPGIPFFNAGQLFAAQIRTIPFQSGMGVRFLTEYGQYYATANNTDLFYQFQGLTSDGKYYIIAILPVSHPLLAANEKPDAFIPQGGISFPGYENETAVTTYYNEVIILLDSAAPDSFTPALGTLDALIQSITITP